MGCCQSDNLKNGSEQIESQHTDEYARGSSANPPAETQSFKILLLGPGDSGKSTLLRQIRKIHGDPYTTQEFLEAKSFIIECTIESMRLIACHSDLLSDEGEDTRVLKKNEEIRTRVARLDKRADFTPELYVDFQKLLEDPGIKNTIQFGNRYHLMDNFEYLCENMHRFFKNDYVPTFEDVIYSRQRTTGVAGKMLFAIKDSESGAAQSYEFVDVGGQRRERRKWVTVLTPDLSAVLYVCALSGFDQNMWEDHNQNRMEEAIALFATVVNGNINVQCDIIVFLNKSDLFEKKLRSTKLSKFFPEYTGDNSFEDAVLFFRDKFETARQDKSKRLFIHVSCATDTQNVKALFASVSDILLRKAMDNDMLT